ncbi:MAG: hypothetical protein ACOYMF_00920 [Bacteroidales bacterium]
MKEKEFQALSHQEKVELLFDQGQELMNRIFVFYNIKLYSLFDFYVEIWYKQTTNKIDKLNIVKLTDIVHLYESQINIQDLFS